MKVVRTVILSLILVFLAFVIYRAAKGGRKIPASTIRAEYRDIESICAYHDFVDSGVVEKRMMLTLLAHTSRDNANRLSPVCWKNCWCRLEMKWWEDSHWHKYDM